MDNYPWGANTKDAPWNQSDPDPVKVDVTVSTTLSKETTIETTDYNIDKWEDCEIDDEGHISRIGGCDYDFSHSDLTTAYTECEYTIPQLLEYLTKYVKADIEQKPHTEGTNATEILRCCEGWVMDEISVI